MVQKNKNELKEQFTKSITEEKKPKKNRLGVKTIAMSEESMENLRIVKDYLGGSSDSAVFVYSLRLVAKAVSEGKLDL